jgi:hypothetical protein
MDEFVSQAAIRVGAEFGHQNVRAVPAGKRPNLHVLCPKCQEPLDGTAAPFCPADGRPHRPRTAYTGPSWCPVCGKTHAPDVDEEQCVPRRRRRWRQQPLNDHERLYCRRGTADEDEEEGATNELFPQQLAHFAACVDFDEVPTISGLGPLLVAHNQELRIPNRGITNETLIRIGNCIRNGCSDLRVIDLSSNEIEDIALEHFFQMLQKGSMGKKKADFQTSFGRWYTLT